MTAIHSFRFLPTAPQFLRADRHGQPLFIAFSPALISAISFFHVRLIRPELALADDGVNGILAFLRRDLCFFRSRLTIFRVPTRAEVPQFSENKRYFAFLFSTVFIWTVTGIIMA